jgi:cell division protein FtsB
VSRSATWLLANVLNHPLQQEGDGARRRKAPPMASSSYAARPRIARGGGVRWDRIGRVALLLVLGLVLLLYIGPLRSFYSTWQEGHSKRAYVRRLMSENQRLEARRRALGDPRTLEAEARRLGMVRPDEHAFVIQGLPKN